MSRYKVYVLVNARMLKPQQQGIQSTHAIVRLIRQNSLAVKEWADNDETIVLLNANTNRRLCEAFARLAATLPYHTVTKYHESEESFDGVLTAVAAVVPEEFWSGTDTELGQYLAEFKLAS